MRIQFAKPPDEALGHKIGRYKILEKVGEGGCGVVYVAEQTEPVRRRVALKVISSAMDKAFAYDDLLKRDKVNLDIFWLKDESLEESANLPAPEVIAGLSRQFGRRRDRV